MPPSSFNSLCCGVALTVTKFQTFCNFFSKCILNAVNVAESRGLCATLIERKGNGRVFLNGFRNCTGSFKRNATPHYLEHLVPPAGVCS